MIAIVLAVLAGAEPNFAETPSRSVLLAQNTGAKPDTAVVTLNPSAVAPDSTPARPSLRGVVPKTALYHSMILPGWGQFDNGKKKKALLFMVAEAAFIGGALYEQNRLVNGDLSRYDKAVARSDRNTFIIYWFGARVAGLVDAYVDAQLWGFNTHDIAPVGFKRPVDDSGTP